MTKVIVHKRAAKYLQKLPQNRKTQVKNALTVLKDDPLAYPGIKQMVGQWAGYYRLRVGSIRIIFWIALLKILFTLTTLAPEAMSINDRLHPLLNQPTLLIALP